MGKTAVKRPSEFWVRLESALGGQPSWQPFNANSVAARLRMSQGSVYRWFEGTGLPELKTALFLAKEGGVCVDWLLNNVKPKHPISNDPILRELFEICEDLDGVGRELLLRNAQGELLRQRSEKEREEEPLGRVRATR